MRKNSFLGFIVIALFASCENFSHKGQGNDIPTAGELTIAFDYGDSMMVTQQLELFHAAYPKAKIQPLFAPENTILRWLEKDSVKAVWMHRKFTPAEKEMLESRKIKVREVLCAKSSIAVVVNKSTGIDRIATAQLCAILKDSFNDWKGIGASEPLVPVFDQPGSSSYLYFRQHWLQGKPMGKKVATLQSPGQMLQWVTTHPNAMGFVSLNWLSDNGDTLSRSLQRKVRVLQVQGSKDEEYHYPFQSQIYTGQYPFVQDVMLYDLQGYSGLGQGLQAWVCSQPGQILVKKCGLLPAVPMARAVEIITK
ncbi:MAG: substrate-binding domain-containing protein [Bacteroidetes bacterium]|nr:substrate-binding domain-containing protein [Bacteroidota bacterium]